ncbi:ABC transporter permease [Elongatibacter sediminis]|uniref:ABC transporter permease n=1 Tax=Elongatibacter sediminis TaxID=3119006 RepID=UPI00339D977E
MPVRVITPHAGLEAFTDAIRSLVRDFPQSRALAWRMLLRDTRAMYRQSLLGYVWLFLPPLATVLVWVLLNSSSLVNIEVGTVPYPLFVITGTVLWTAFNASVMAMQEIMGSARSMLSKVNFPHEALIMTAFGKALLNSVIPALLLVPALIVYGIPPGLPALLFPLGFLTLLLLGCALGLLFVPIGALYGDVGRAIQMGLRFGFFVTPVIYAMPESALTRTLLLWNPVSAPLVSSRSWLIGGESVFVWETVLVGLISIFLLAIATLVFKVVMPHLIERLNA